MSISRVTVGIDHSETSTAAVQWAAELANASELPLRVVHAWQIPYIAFAPEMMGPLPDEALLREWAEEFVAKQVAELGIDEAERVIVHGSAGAHMAEESDDDCLVVVGRTGRGAKVMLARIVDGLLGSTARYLVHNADGPVALVPSDSRWTTSPRVIVGVDGTTASLAALRWAVESLPADAKITALRYIIPWVSDPLVPVDNSFNPTLVANAEAEVAKWVDEVVDASSRPGRKVRVQADIGAASWALTTASRDADMVVVGHRDRSVLATRLLGSVADHTVRHSHVPVIVVPEPD
jgi:nucleotide-binding universal stress UspA family protein